MTINPIPRYTLDVTIEGGYAIKATPIGGGEPISGDDNVWMLGSDVEAVFARGVAYMPVPRCEMCKWWGLTGNNFKLHWCPRVGIATAYDFGCVQREAKS